MLSVCSTVSSTILKTQLITALSASFVLLHKVNPVAYVAQVHAMSTLILFFLVVYAEIAGNFITIMPMTKIMLSISVALEKKNPQIQGLGKSGMVTWASAVMAYSLAPNIHNDLHGSVQCLIFSDSQKSGLP